MGNRYFTLRNEKDEGHSIPYVFDVAFCDDVVAQIREDGDECPDDAAAASFTYDDPTTDIDGVLYFPHDVGLRIIVHEAAHAVIGLCHRKGEPVPTRYSSDAQEEAFVETVALLAEHIHDAATEEEQDDGVGERQ